MNSQIDELLIIPINAENKLKIRGKIILNLCSFKIHYNYDINPEKVKCILKGRTVILVLIIFLGFFR